jgi:hypothetical protein
MQIRGVIDCVVPFLLCTREVLGSKLCTGTDSPDYCYFSEFLQAGVGIVPLIKPQELRLTSFSINYLLIIVTSTLHNLNCVVRYT